MSIAFAAWWLGIVAVLWVAARCRRRAPLPPTQIQPADALSVTTARGNLYDRARGLETSAQALQAGARHRLGFPDSGDFSDEEQKLLTTTQSPASAAQLIAYAQALQAIEDHHSEASWVLTPR